MEYRILGPVEVTSEDRPLPIGAGNQRALLGLLLLRANRVVSIERLIEDLWGEEAPDTAVHMLHVYVSRLRKVLASAASGGPEPDVLVTRPPGYVLRVGPEELDLVRFQSLAAQGKRALDGGRAREASDALSRGLDLWRGPPLADVEFDGPVDPELTRLREERLAALELRIEADLALGRHRTLVAELRSLVDEHPLRERFRGLLMLALYRCGSQAEAVSVYHEGRVALAEELGIDPSPELQRLLQSVLTRDPSLDRAPGLGGPEPEAVRRSVWNRRTVLAATAGLPLIAAGVVALFLIRQGGPVFRARPNSVLRMDSGTGQVTAEAGVGRGPAAIAATARGVWVANFDDRTISKIDPRTGRSGGRFGNVGVPSDVAASTGSVWVADSFSGTVRELDPSTGQVVARVGGFDGPAALAVGFGSVWVADVVDDSVVRIDPHTAQRIATIALPAEAAGPTDIVTGAGGVWVMDRVSRTVSKIDPESDRLTAPAIGLCCRPSAIAAGATSVWVTSEEGNVLLRIDSATDAVASTTSIAGGPLAVAASRDGAWVGACQSMAVWHVDDRGRRNGPYPVHACPTAIGILGRRVWIAVGSA